MEATYLFRSNKFFWIVKNVLSIIVILGLFLNSVNFVLAEEIDGTTELEQSHSHVDGDEATTGNDTDDRSSVENPNLDGTIPDPVPEATEPEPNEETLQADTTFVPTPEGEQEQGLDPSVVEEVATTTEEVIPTGKKFIKDPSLSPEEQLAAVRQHLLREGLPQVAVNRLNTWEAQIPTEQKEDGIFKKMWDFVTGNTEEAKEQRKIEKLMNSEPFKVEEFTGKINTVPVEKYEHDFSEAREQGNFIQKVKNLIETGSFFNVNPHKTEEKKGNILSWLFGPAKAIADASNDPSDYLADGEEIQFTQAIQDKAVELNNDPLEILNFVLNDVEYIPYYGSKKGANATLLEQAGNDTDKASLLIAMLRESDTPARYRQVDAKIEIDTMNALLGMPNATSSAQLLSLQDIPYALYTANGEAQFFVVEHTYVEAYLPYGVSRGTASDDGGTEQWVPMDPTITEYGFELPYDTVGAMVDDGFNIENFFDNYLNGDYGTSTEPLDAFKSEVDNYLTSSSTPGYFPAGVTYDDVLVAARPKNNDLNFIPGSLPFDISADLDTYDYMPSSLRHTIEFTVLDDSTEVLNHTSYVSDLADQEIILTYEAATEDDQEIIDGFESIYDVVPLSLVAVVPKLKVAGQDVATGVATSTMGVSHDYMMEFYAPVREMGESVTPELVKTSEKGIVSGTSDGIALNTDRIVPVALLSDIQGETDSFLSHQLLYKTAVDYLLRLEETHRELADLTGRDFVHVATKASISNGVVVTKSMGQPYSFEWVGLRIDASAKVRGFSRFKEITHNKEEFYAVFGLQASQDESDIFEENYGVQSVATVKGLKLVANGEFPSISLVKITDANEGDIESLLVATSTRNAFHTAIGEGRTIYTPSAPVTYDDWEGLFYITVDFAGGDGLYAIGEGLNGGYTTKIEQFDAGVMNALIKGISILGLSADITSPSNDSSYQQGQKIHWVAEYDGPGFFNWTEDMMIGTSKAKLGTHTLRSGYGTTNSVNVKITKTTLGQEGQNTGIDQDIIDAIAAKSLDPDFAPVLKLVFQKETNQKLQRMRYEPCVDVGSVGGYLASHPWDDWRLPNSAGANKGSQVDSLKQNHGKTPYEMAASFVDFGLDMEYGDSIQTVYTNNNSVQHFDTASECTSGEVSGATQPAQFLIASSFGIGQVIYLWYAEEFDTTNSGEPARDIWDLFGQREGVKGAAHVLKNAWNSRSSYAGVGSDCDPGDRLWQTLATYNAGSNFLESRPQDYAKTICTQFKAGQYSAITN